MYFNDAETSELLTTWLLLVKYKKRLAKIKDVFYFNFI